jgi:ubiquinone/menaquinone biosynthesis C-methylase UbiE
LKNITEIILAKSRGGFRRMKSSQNRIKEREFWDNLSQKERAWIQNTTKAEIIDKIKSDRRTFEGNEKSSLVHWWEELIGKVKGKKILDIGCGNSYFVTYWQLTGNEAYGCDFSPETVENNNFLHAKLGLKQNFYVSSAEEIKAESDSLDIVHMRWTIHHIPEELQDSSIREMRRVLKPGGRLIVFETNYTYPFRWIVQTPILRGFNILRKYAINKGWLDPEEKALTNKGYVDLLKRNGFKIEKIDYDFTFFRYPVGLLTKNKFMKNFAQNVDYAITKFLPKKFCKDVKIIAEK